MIPINSIRPNFTQHSSNTFIRVNCCALHQTLKPHLHLTLRNRAFTYNKTTEVQEHHNVTSQTEILELAIRGSNTFARQIDNADCSLGQQRIGPARG